MHELMYICYCAQKKKKKKNWRKGVIWCKNQVCRMKHKEVMALQKKKTCIRVHGLLEAKFDIFSPQNWRRIALEILTTA